MQKQKFFEVPLKNEIYLDHNFAYIRNFDYFLLNLNIFYIFLTFSAKYPIALINNPIAIKFVEIALIITP